MSQRIYIYLETYFLETPTNLKDNCSLGREKHITHNNINVCVDMQEVPYDKSHNGYA